MQMRRQAPPPLHPRPLPTHTCGPLPQQGHQPLPGCVAAVAAVRVDSPAVRGRGEAPHCWFPFPASFQEFCSNIMDRVIKRDRCRCWRLEGRQDGRISTLHGCELPRPRSALRGLLGRWQLVEGGHHHQPGLQLVVEGGATGPGPPVRVVHACMSAHMHVLMRLPFVRDSEDKGPTVCIASVHSPT